MTDRCLNIQLFCWGSPGWTFQLYIDEYFIRHPGHDVPKILHAMPYRLNFIFKCWFWYFESLSAGYCSNIHVEHTLLLFSKLKMVLLCCLWKAVSFLNTWSHSRTSFLFWITLMIDQPTQIISSAWYCYPRDIILSLPTCSNSTEFS